MRGEARPKYCVQATDDFAHDCGHGNHFGFFGFFGWSSFEEVANTGLALTAEAKKSRLMALLVPKTDRFLPAAPLSPAIEAQPARLAGAPS